MMKRENLTVLSFLACEGNPFYNRCCAGGRGIMTVTIRAAAAGDADAICVIHNQGIADRLATLDTTERTPAGVRTWLAERSPRHPVIVADADGQIVGWGSLNQFNAR